MNDVSRGIPGDNEVWMSYAEAARALGIDIGSVKKRARRRAWRRQPGNDGTTRIAVPRDALGDVPRDVPADDRRDTSAAKPAPSPGTSSETDAAVQALRGQIAAVESHNATLREQLAKAEGRAKRAEERAERAEQRLIDELARLAGQNIPAPGPVPDDSEQQQLDEVLAELRTEFGGEGPQHGPEKPAQAAEDAVASPEPVQAEAPSRPALAPPAIAPVTPPQSESRRIWWSWFVPRRRRSA
jgi:hypothetical protein